MSRPRRRGRDVHGVLLLDKPQGASSNDVLQKVKRIYNANRAGHTGALDPLATGMLPICLGEATKFSQYLLDSDKRYRVIAKLGQRTDTSDADGQVVEERPVTFSAEQLDAALDSFRGDTLQVPSMYSALKYQGKKLYEYARQGIEVPREARPITVYELLFIRHEGDELELEVHCSKGTYIRTIIDDLGEKLGCGAHVIYLRRLAVSKYPVERMVTLEELKLSPLSASFTLSYPAEGSWPFTQFEIELVCRDGSSIVVDGGNGFSDFGPDGQGGRDYFYGVHAFDAPIPLDQIDHIQFGAYKLLLPE